MENEVLFSVSDGGVANIVLNRPLALNSLSYEMLKPIGEKLKEWEANEEVHIVVLKGEGSKGFCAGGDIKMLYQACSSPEALEKAETFFEVEYQVDLAIYNYSKPIIACLDGIVMGGGVGLTYGASHRVVTERTKWAMPETDIGFFPDVGAAYFLNKAPGFLGRYLALTAAVIQSEDILFANAADYFMESKQLLEFLSRVEQTDWHGQEVLETLNKLVAEYTSRPLENGKLAAIQCAVDEHFSQNSITDIFQSLDNDSSNFALETKQLLLSKSPSSLKITLKQLIDGVNQSVEECFATDFILAKNFLKHEDFYEGVRSVVIDKDRNPQYFYKTVSDFSDEAMDKFFQDSSVTLK
ncbi:enoyl-CoA hydratase/isomerase family protein [Lysinibacillus sp. NPDC097162]|uniref:enoyl-CoA hydratase/isomerase family protein n=1 Tax=Lysinibacillus sp. NPDC097162 TaxID=3364140 RepID=UPI0037F8FFF3